MVRLLAMGLLEFAWPKLGTPKLGRPAPKRLAKLFWARRWKLFCLFARADGDRDIDGRSLCFSLRNFFLGSINFHTSFWKVLSWLRALG